MAFSCLIIFLPWHLGVPDGVLSGLEKFEGPDPAEFIPRGFAIVNVDARGAGDSEGGVAIMGTKEAEDGTMSSRPSPPCLGAVAMLA